MSEKLVCVQCGHPWRPSAKKCYKCGSRYSRLPVANPEAVAAMATLQVSELKKKLDEEGYEAITIQALHMRNEVFGPNGGTQMDRDTFDETYLGGIGDYERKLAKREGIKI